MTIDMTTRRAFLRTLVVGVAVAPVAAVAALSSDKATNVLIKAPRTATTDEIMSVGGEMHRLGYDGVVVLADADEWRMEAMP